MPIGSPEPPSGLDDAERSTIKALWQSFVTRRQGSYVDVHEEFHLLVKGTLRAFSEQENALRMVNQLPTELFIHVASFLGQRDLWMSTLVCRSWRARLLGSPRLWTRICVSQSGFSARWSTRSLALLEILFARSQSLLLSIEFRCLHDEDDDEFFPEFEEYGNVADLIAAEMHRVRSLSLVLPCVRSTTFEDLLATAAPVLVCFRIYVTKDSEYLPEFLFDEHAPSLTSLAFSTVDFNPSYTYVAVRAVEHFAHDAHIIMPADVDAIARLLPALQSLTLAGDECEVDESTTVCTRPLAVNLPNIDSILPVFNVFPNATSFCLSSAMDFSDLALQALFETAGHPTSIDLDYGASRLVHPKALDEPSDIGICIKLNGMDVAVDLGIGEVCEALEFLSERLQSVQHISINEDLWLSFGPRLAIPSVRELTVYLDPPRADEAGWCAAGLIFDPAALDVVLPSFDLSLLRLVAPSNARIPSLEESFVADVVQTMGNPNTLRTLVLCGVEMLLRPSSRLRSLVPHLNIVSEQSPSPPEARPWFWTFPAEDAVHI